MAEAIIFGDTTGSANETDAPITINGNLDVTDEDGAAEEAFVPLNGVDGDYGEFTIDTTGLWSYTTFNAQNQFAAGQNYFDTFQVETVDGTFEDVVITITGTNDAPTTVDDPNEATTENASVVISPLANDSDPDAGDTLTISAFNIRAGQTFGDPPQTGAPGTATLSLDGTQITYDPGTAFDYLAAGETATVLIDYRAKDSSGAEPNQNPPYSTITVTVTGTNDAPVAVADSYTTAEDTPLVVEAPGVFANDSDADGDSFTAELLTSPANGDITAGDTTTGSFTYTPDPNFTGTDSFTYRIFDGTAYSDPVTVTINVTPVNDAAPVAVADSYTATEDTALTVAAPGVLGNDTDADGDPLTATVATGPSNGTLTLNPDGSFTYTPNANYNGTDSFTYTANDGTADSAPVTVTITVDSVNDAPVAAADSYSATEDTALTVAAPGVLGNDTDADGDPLTASVATGPSNGTLTLNPDGSFTYTPNANYNGTDSFTYVANDGTADSAPVTVTITVDSVNDVPVAAADSYTATEDTALTVAAPGVLGNDTDADGDPLTASVATGPSNGTLTLNPDGSFTYTPNANYNGTDSFTYVANDGTTDSAPVTVSLTVTSVNDAPVAVADSLTAPETVSTTFAASALLANDTDVDNPNSDLTIASVANGTGGTVVLNGDGSVTFTPTPGFNGPATFTYTTTDGSATSAPATVTVDVTPTNDIIIGTPEPDTLNGYGGNDRIFGRESDDVIDGGVGNDQLFGEGGNDTIRGGAGDDLVDGGDGNDRLFMDDGGDDTALGGAGRDIIYYGGALTAADVNDGGEGTDALALQGNYDMILGAANLFNVEFLSLQTGQNPAFGQSGTNSYDYDLTSVNENVAAGQTLTVNAQSLRSDESFTFDGSAETDGKFFFYAGGGTDDLTGGAGNDIFFFEGSRLGASDAIDGGGGTDAMVITGVAGANVIVLGENQLTSIEVISFNPRFNTDQSVIPTSYDLTLDQGNIPEGGTLIVNGSSLVVGTRLIVDGSDVTAGSLVLFGGGDNDQLTGGDGNDEIEGGGASDILRGGDGADTFVYADASDSSEAPDQILDFTSGTDKIDLSLIDAISGTPENDAFTFSPDGNFHNMAGEVRVRASGAGSWFVEGDVNGDGAADFQIEVFTTGGGPLVVSDFVL